LPSSRLYDDGRGWQKFGLRQVVTNELLKISLAGGRSVAISEYGVRNGAPIFFCHCWPSSRTMAELTESAACALQLRIISPDRPGFRNSSLHP
jgi:hypothetical protein